jgi:hypothetical protein
VSKYEIKKLLQQKKTIFYYIDIRWRDLGEKDKMSSSKNVIKKRLLGESDQWTGTRRG